MIDCNSYSYIKATGKSKIIAEAKNGYCISTVSLTAEENYFGDRYYYVSDIMGDFAEMYPLTPAGYKQAVIDYNKLVPESDRI